jgi:protein gp37
MRPTGISYGTRSWSPTTGCSRGCSGCWARGLSRRIPAHFGGDFTPRCWPERLHEPLHAKKPQVILVSFRGDLFDSRISPEFVGQTFGIMQQARQHIFLVLTKCVDRMREVVPVLVAPVPPENLYIGFSAWDQASFDAGIAALHATPAAHKWCSLEPLLGPVDVRGGMDCLDGIIAGCESGSQRRPARHEWFADLAAQCALAGRPFYLKQMAEREDGSGGVVHYPPAAGALAWDLPK